MRFPPPYLMLMLAVFAGTARLAADEPQPLTKVADIRSLSRSEAAKAPPVRVKGVVTLLWWKGSINWVVQDESAGIWVFVEEAKRRGIWQGDDALEDELREGSLVEIEGVVDPGGFAPVILPRSIRIAGQGELPAAESLPFSAWVSGAHDFRLAVVEGVVTEIRSLKGAKILRLDSQNGGFLAEVRVSESLANNLVGAEVRIQGVPGTTFNSRGEFICLRFLANNDRNVQILKPAPADPFAVPKVPVSDFSSFSSLGRRLQRRKIEGIVTLCAPGSHVYLQDGKTAIRVRMSGNDVLRPGDRVEASGFVDHDRPVAGMVGAAIRKTGEGAPPESLPLEWADLLRAYEPLYLGRSASPHDFDGWLVRMRLHLLQIHYFPQGSTQLILSSGERTITASLPPVKSAEDRGKLDALRLGSLVEITGVTELEFAKASGRSSEAAIPVGLSLQMRDIRDVTVLMPASWWTPGRLLWVLAILACASGGAVLWVMQLRRTVARQARHIEETLRAHRDSKLEMKGAREERYRLAADLHDGLQQHLTGASFRLEAALMRLGEIPPEVREQFTAARSALEITRSGLRECLLGLRHVEEGPAEFPALLRHVVAKMEHWPRDAVEVVMTGDPFPLSRSVMGSLLLFMQEAVSNAFRHGSASHVRVSLNYLLERLELRVEDDGSGFDLRMAPDSSSGHFGLESMRHRFRWLGGTMEIDSQPGKGTRVIGRLSRKSAAGENPEIPADAADAP